MHFEPAVLTRREKGHRVFWHDAKYSTLPSRRSALGRNPISKSGRFGSSLFASDGGDIAFLRDDMVDGGGPPPPIWASRYLLQPPETTTTGGCPVISGHPSTLCFERPWLAQLYHLNLTQSPKVSQGVCAIVLGRPTSPGAPGGLRTRGSLRRASALGRAPASPSSVPAPQFPQQNPSPSPSPAPLLSTSSAHLQPPLAKGGRVVCLPCSPS